MNQPVASKQVCQVRRRRWYHLAAILLGLSVFAVLELLLFALDLGRPSTYVDPFVGFSQTYSLFELDRRAGEYRTANARLHFFAPQRFAAKKSPGGFRAFCLGGSTVLGHPYQPDSAFSKWLELELSGMDPTRQFEIVNCGGMSYASYRLIPILEEVLRYEPDLIVLMTGHNEFLEDRTYEHIKRRPPLLVSVQDRLYGLRTVTLLRRSLDWIRGGPRPSRGKTVLRPEVDAKLDHPGGYASYHRDELWHAGVVGHYAENLRVMVDLCRKAGVAIILINPGSNLRDCPPFKSEHRAGLDSSSLAAWTAAFDAGSAAEQLDPARALESYREAERIDPEHAQLVYRIARCLDRLAQFDQAREAYVRAKDLDVCPLRITEPMQQLLRNVATETQTPLVDARRLLEERSPQHIAGYHNYVDQVHPSIGGHQLIAQALTGQLIELGLIRANATWGDRERRAAYARQLSALGDLYLAQGRKRVEFLETWARRDRMRSDRLPQDARGFLDLGHAYMEFAKYPEARAAYRRALDANADLAANVLDHAIDLYEQGRTSAARQLARWVADQTADSSLRTRAETTFSTFEANAEIDPGPE